MATPDTVAQVNASSQVVSGWAGLAGGSTFRTFLYTIVAALPAAAPAAAAAPPPTTFQPNFDIGPATRPPSVSPCCRSPRPTAAAHVDYPQTTAPTRLWPAAGT
jgi:hypothetical protein